MKNRILICNGTSGISAGARKVGELFEEGLKRHQLQDDYEVVMTGDRGLFRDVLVDIVPPHGERITYEYVTPEDVSTILEEHLVKGEPVEKKMAGEDYKQFFASQTRIVLANCGEIDPKSLDDYVAHNGYKALQKCFKMTPDETIEQMKIRRFARSRRGRISHRNEMGFLQTGKREIRNISSATRMKAIRARLWIAAFWRGTPCGGGRDDHRRLCHRCHRRVCLLPR
jgi:hypothetical protein